MPSDRLTKPDMSRWVSLVHPAPSLATPMSVTCLRAAIPRWASKGHFSQRLVTPAFETWWWWWWWWWWTADGFRVREMPNYQSIPFLQGLKKRPLSPRMRASLFLKSVMSVLRAFLHYTPPSPRTCVGFLSPHAKI